MKHILNNIPTEVKNDILRQHSTGKGKQIDVEKMKHLFEAKQGDVKPYIKDLIKIGNSEKSKALIANSPEKTKLIKLLEKLEKNLENKLKSDFSTGGNLKTYHDIYRDLFHDRVRIENLRLIIDLENGISVVENEHTPTKVRYVIGRAYWYNPDGVKERIFAKNMGSTKKLYNEKGELPEDKRQELVDKVRELMIEKFNKIYPDTQIN
jgi:hypothetical protein